MREFTGWIQGRPEDYIMNLQRQQHRSKAQSNTRKTAVGPKLNLFSPGIKNDYEYLIKKQNEVANFTYKMGECRVYFTVGESSGQRSEKSKQPHHTLSIYRQHAFI